ncbi:MAG TPA: hypothetical protein VIM71_12720, partial [Lacunisphaera sp.]
MIHTDRTELQQSISARLGDFGARRERQLPAVDARIQAWLDQTFSSVGPVPRLPTQTFALDQAG